MDKPVLMPIEDIFSIQGRGTVVTGRIETGVCKVGEEMEIVGFRDTRKTVVTGVEMFKKLLGHGHGGRQAHSRLLLRGIEKNGVERGRVIAKPGSIKTAQEVQEAKRGIEQAMRAGRHTPFFKELSSGVLFPDSLRTSREFTGPAGRHEEKVMLGDNVQLVIDLITIRSPSSKACRLRSAGRTHCRRGNRVGNH